ncbi:MAG: hypothetical protein HXX13_03875 [Bacteroidetes bacterium]|nr:hypothetical protein [Bacteroidota bacterium]
MKKYFFPVCLFAVFSFLALTSKSQQCSYYPIKQGAVLGYQSLDEKGKIVSTSKVTIQDIIQSGLSTEYKVKSEFWDDKNKPTQSREYSMKCVDGNFSVELKSMIDPKSFDGLKNMELTFSGDDLSYPSSLSAGMTLPDASMIMAAGSGGITLMRMTIKVTERKVAGVETVTVPAGTFECYKITYNLETKFGARISSSAIQWLNRGAGCVKTETYDSKGKLVGSTLLKEFTP